MAAVLAVAVGGSVLRDRLGDRAPANLDPDPGVVHVHGLGVNPADGELLAATHTGLFELSAGRTAVRVEDRYQDTMAFTVTGPDQFLGSGHPDLREIGIIPQGGRPLLGLIRSTDAGRSWQPQSLLGTVDFHSLVVAHGLVFGLDSTGGRLLVSSDRKEWESRAEVAALDMVVSPDSPEVVLATDGSAVLGSTDGGRSFTPRPGPPLAFVEWPSAAALWGVTLAGEVYASADGGGTWTMRSELGGKAEAFAAAGGDLYAAIADRGIFRSRGSGSSWELYYRNGGKVAGRLR